MNNILILTTKYPKLNESNWLTSELAEELVRVDQKVYVLVLDWEDSNQKHERVSDKIVICRLKPYRFKKNKKIDFVLKWYASSIKLCFALFFYKKFKKKFDLVITFSPASIMWAPVLFYSATKVRKIIFYWDFYPEHNFQIRNISNKFTKYLKMFESYLLQKIDVIAMISEGTLKEFCKKFSKVHSEKIVLPIWTDVSDVKFKISSGEIKLKKEIRLIFGGQLSHGRGIEDLIKNYIDSLPLLNKKSVLFFAGSGELKEMIEMYSKKFPENIRYLGAVSREEYCKLLEGMDVGVVSTDRGVNVPSFPSKALDYLKLGLPILAFVDNFTDFATVVNSNNLGIACSNDDLKNIRESFSEMINNDSKREKMSEGSQKFLVDNFSVEKVVNQILSKG